MKRWDPPEGHNLNDFSREGHVEQCTSRDLSESETWITEGIGKKYSALAEKNTLCSCCLARFENC